jgi:hypothetical protein
MLFDYFPPVISLGLKRSIEMTVRMGTVYTILTLALVLLWPKGFGFDLRATAGVVIVGALIIILPFIFSTILIPTIIMWMGVGLLTGYVLNRFLDRLSPRKAALIGLGGAGLILLPAVWLFWQAGSFTDRPALTYGILLPIGLSYPLLSAWFGRSLYLAAMQLFAMGQDPIYYHRS